MAFSDLALFNQVVVSLKREPEGLPNLLEAENEVLMRVNIQLACTECKRRNYSTEKNKKNTTGRLEVKKYCPFDKKHTVHRETK